MAQPLSALPNGALVKDPTSTQFGAPIVWRKANTNHPGYPANSVTLITDRVIRLAGFDASEPGNSDSNRALYGNNRYRTSNLRQWLNSLGAANSWWAAQNLTAAEGGTLAANNRDAAPTTAGMANHNGYDNVAGFMTFLSANFRNAILDTTLPPVVRNTVTDGGSTETVTITDKIFLASTTEVGLANENSIAEGTVFPIFTGGNSSRIANITPEAAANGTGGPAANAACWWWLRTPVASYSYSVRLVITAGTLGNGSACDGNWGVRPLCNLQSGILVSDNTDSDGAYTIMWRQAPTMPATLNVPGTIIGGGTPTISWTASTDQNTPPEAVQYRLDRATNGGTFANIYTGPNLSFVDTVAAGTTSVQYRVRAFNTTGLESANNTGSVINIITNSPPVISGSDSSLGVQTAGFTQGYTVTDPDLGDTITVTERLNGVQIRQYVATSGAAQTLTVSQTAFLGLGSGTHTLTVTASDQHNATALRTWTFSRDAQQTSQIQVSLEAPLPADDMPTRILVSVGRQIPTGATFQVQVCNNGNDASPTWEDCTGAVLSGTAFTFTNSTKTAADWGVNIRVNVNRNSATGPCFITSIGGNFE